MRTMGRGDGSWRVSRWPADRWIEASVAVVALAALFVSIDQGCQTRRHNRLSVRPKLVHDFYYGDDGAGWKRVSFGSGPARLRGFRIQVDGKPVRDLQEFVSRLGVPPGTPLTFTNPMVGSVYAPGHENVLIWTKSSSGADILRKQWPRAVVQTCYCSAYDECWLSSSDGSWQGDQGEHLRDDDCSPFAGEERSRWWQG